MKKILYIALLLALPFACTKPSVPNTDDKNQKQEENQEQKQDPVLNSITLSLSTLELKVEDTKVLTVTVDPADFSTNSLKWSSSNPSVASVTQNGLVKAVAVGNAVITASLAGKEASCTVTVTAKEVEQPEEWDGETFVDRTNDWECVFVDYGSYWLWEVHSITTPYYHIKYIMEGEDFMGASEAVRISPVDIKAAYEYFCVNVDYEEFLVKALKDSVPGWEELVWPEGYGHAQGYVFGFDENKKFTGEYAHVTSEHVF